MTIRSFFRFAFRASTTSAALAVALLGSSLLSQSAQAQTYLPAYTTTGVLGGHTSTSVSSSFGFYFDVAGNNVQVDGLGFSAQTAWSNGTTYNVTLWSYANGGTSPSDYTPIATSTFTAGTTYTLQDNYYWQTFVGAPLSLPDTFTTDTANNFGYVIAAIGDFSNALGNVQFESGTPTFDPRILNAGNGFNDSTDMGGFYPIPFYVGGVGTNGYFNPNLSLVPGPLPVLGAAAGFGWTRRLRKRIRASK